MKAGDFMKKMKSFVSVFLTIAMVCGAIDSVVFASSVSDISGSVTKIVKAVAYIGYALAIAMLAFLGIKYAMSPANEKADVKQASTSYVIGAFLIFCASSIAAIFAKIAAGSAPTTSLGGTIIEAAIGAAG